MPRVTWQGVVVMGLILACVSVAQALAQDGPGSFFGQRVTTVRFQVEGQDAALPELVAISEVRAGQPLRPEDVRATLARLDSLGRYDDIVPVATRAADGVEIVFRLTPRHPISRIVVSGDAGPLNATVRERILQRYGGVPASARPDAVAAAARVLLEDEGYFQADVQPDVTLVHDPESAILTLTVVPGPVARVAHTDVLLRGASLLSAPEVISRTRTAQGAPYRRRDLDAALTSLEDALRLRGYYEAQATAQASPGPDGYRLDLVVDTGPRVEVHIEPAGALPGNVDDLIPIKRLGSADQDLLEDAQVRIEARLQEDGYWKATAPFTRELSADGQVLVITYRVTRGPRGYIDHIALPDSPGLSRGRVADLLEVSAGDVFDARRFQTGLARVADEYRRTGYYKVDVRPRVEIEELTDRRTADRAWLVLHPSLTEGPRAVVSQVGIVFTAPARVPREELTALLRTVSGEPYVESDSALDRLGIRTFYLNRGFRSADIAVEPSFSDDGRVVNVTFRINEGPQVLIGDIVVVGNERVSEASIRDELRLEAGQPAGEAALQDAQRRLVEMGVFRRATISAAEVVGGENRTHLVVSVVESPNTTFGFGGGLEVGRAVRSAVGGGNEDYLAVSPRLFFDIGRRNIGGRNRSLSLFSRVSPKQRQAPDDPTRDGRGFGFTEYRMTGTYRERRVLQTQADAVLSVTAEQAKRTNFSFARRSVTLEGLRRMSATVNLSGRYSLDFTRLLEDRIPENEVSTIDRLFPQVRLSLFQTGVSWDRRDNPLSASRGTFVTGDVELASTAFGSEVGYVKTFVQASHFVPVDPSRRTVLALRGQLGTALGFARAVPLVDAAGQALLDGAGAPLTSTVRDLPASQRFFAGGSTTVRGFQADRLGAANILTANGLSLGGNGLVVLNAEVRRVLVPRRLSAVVFLDGGNVFARTSEIRLGTLRGAAGFGVRADSPLGPIRFDIGFKLSPGTIDGRPDGKQERRWEYHLSIGEAF